MLSNGQPNGAILSQQFTQYAKSCIEPGYEYFQGKFHGALRIAVAAFRAARLFAPHKVRDLQPDANAVDEISAFPFLNDTKILDDLKAELPQYLASAADVVEDVDIVDWWKRHAEGLPHWSHAVRSILLVQPSSAAAERVFSILNSTFSDRQDSSLEDYIESSVMLQYNNR